MCDFSDLNIDLMDKNPQPQAKNNYINMLNSSAFHVLLNKPTRITPDSETLIDHVLRNYIRPGTSVVVRPRTLRSRPRPRTHKPRPRPRPKTFKSRPRTQIKNNLHLSDFSMKSQNVVGHLVMKYGSQTIYGEILQTYKDNRFQKLQG